MRMMSAMFLLLRRRARNRARLRALNIARCRDGLSAAKIVVSMSSHRERHYLTVKDLLPLRESPWVQLKAARQEKGALQVMGITWEAFFHLLQLFKPRLRALWD